MDSRPDPFAILGALATLWGEVNKVRRPPPPPVAPRSPPMPQACSHVQEQADCLASTILNRSNRHRAYGNISPHLRNMLTLEPVFLATDSLAAHVESQLPYFSDPVREKCQQALEVVREDIQAVGSAILRPEMKPKLVGVTLKCPSVAAPEPKPTECPMQSARDELRVIAEDRVPAKDAPAPPPPSPVPGATEKPSESEKPKVAPPPPPPFNPDQIMSKVLQDMNPADVMGMMSMIGQSPLSQILGQLSKPAELPKSAEPAKPAEPKPAEPIKQPAYQE